MKPTMTHSAFPNLALGTFSFAGCPPFPGLVLGDRAVAVSAVEGLCRELGYALPNCATMQTLLDQWEASQEALRAAARALTSGQVLSAPVAAQMVSLSSLRIHAPVSPRQVFCCGANYFKHVVDLMVDQGPGANPDTEGMSPAELRSHAQALMQKRQREGVPYFFSKPASAVTGPYDPIVVAPHATQPDWELELAVVIGKPGHRIPLERAMDHVAGYTIANDISNRDRVYRRDEMKVLGTDWIASKSQPSYLPLGPFLVPASEVNRPDDLRLRLHLNGNLMQDGHTSDMIFGIARQIEYISSMVQLLPGDVICTGSPAGNGTHHHRFLEEGDVVDATIEQLGTQRNRVTRK